MVSQQSKFGGNVTVPIVMNAQVRHGPKAKVLQCQPERPQAKQNARIRIKPPKSRQVFWWRRVFADVSHGDPLRFEPEQAVQQQSPNYICRDPVLTRKT